jgi:hypothetical protein
MKGKNALDTFREFQYTNNIPFEYLQDTFNQKYDAMLKDFSLIRSHQQFEETIKYKEMREFEAQVTKRLKDRNHDGYSKRVLRFPLGSCKKEVFDKLFWEQYYDVVNRKSFTDFSSDSFGNIVRTENVTYEFRFPRFPPLQDTTWCYRQYTVNGPMGQEHYRNLMSCVKFFYKEREGMAFCSFEHATQTICEGDISTFWMFIC